MSHMQAQAIFDTMLEYTIMGETFLIPEEYRDDIPDDAEIGEIFSDGWFSRLSAPGYTDCTEWQGPYKTEDGALWELYQMYGDDSETFFSFLGEGKKIIWGSLSLTGSRNELYGKVVGEFWNKKPEEIHLATLGDIDLDQDTGEIHEYYPNDDPDLAEAYQFEIITGDELIQLTQRVKNAERDSEFYRIVTVFIGWSDQTWGHVDETVPVETKDYLGKAVQNVVERGDRLLCEDDRLELSLGLDLPDPLFYGVLKVTDPLPYDDATPKFGDMTGIIGDTGDPRSLTHTWLDLFNTTILERSSLSLS